MLPKNRPPMHPGALLAESLEQTGMTQVELAEKLGVSIQTVNTLIKGKRGMSPALALALAKVFDITPEMWMNLQTNLELWQARQKMEHSTHR